MAYFLGTYFAIGYPVALMARLLFGQDSDNVYAWPDKYWVEGRKSKPVSVQKKDKGEF